METVDGVHAANVGIISTAKTLVFINTGQTEPQAAFLWDLAQSRAPGREMTYVILTHHHLDHCYAASYFDDRHSLIYAHKSFSACMAETRKHLGATDYQSMLEAFLKIDSDTYRTNVGNVHPVAPHRHIGDEMSLAVNGEEIVMMHCPGHTVSEIVIYHPRTKTLYAGDAINEVAGPVTMFSDVREWRKWVAGLEKIKKFEIETIVPGHGEVCEPDIIDSHIEALEKKIEESSQSAR